MALENNIEQSVAKNWTVLFQNFRKVVTWMKSGLDSPEALAMPEDYAITKLFKAAKAHDASVTAVTKQVSMLTAQNTELQEGLSVTHQKIAQLLQQVDVLTTELQTLRTTLSEPAEPKPTKKGKAKAEPEVAQVVEPAPVATPAPAAPVAQTPDEVQLTAAAVDAGELSEDALAQVSELLGSMEAL